ncbi:MAG: hypothetical protein K0Q55_727 [Verrucomicrobia bacterium]|nr:hypothetical protein [Verrucomicrobiota bacterium]
MPVVVFYGGLLSVSLILLVRKKFKQGILLGAGTLLLAQIAIPGMPSARSTAQRNACNANLKQVNGAIEKWSKENNMAAGDKIDVAAIASSMKNGKMPACAQGGFYKLSVLGKPVECSLSKHAVSSSP